MSALTPRARLLFLSTLLGLAVLAGGCASTGGAGGGGGGGGIPLIPEGKGRLLLETGGIPELNFYVIDQATDQEVYSQTPRASGSSPLGYERSGVAKPIYVDLAPGTYTLVVNTDIKDNVEVHDIPIAAGQDRYASVPLGRFQILYSSLGGDGLPSRQQVPFLIYDYNLRTVLGKGMTSTDLRYFIVPAGNYKVRLENSQSGLDEIRPVQVTFGGTQNITISPQQDQVPASATDQTDQE